MILVILLFFTKNSYTQNFKQFNHNVKNYNKKIEIFSKNGEKKAEFMVAIADDDEKRKYGLMNLEKLNQQNGMLFLFEKGDIIYMWMKNTMISLDMIFINDDEIVSFFENAKPQNLDVISSKKKADKVLEINGSLIKKYKIKIGDKIKFEL